MLDSLGFDTYVILLILGAMSVASWSTILQKLSQTRHLKEMPGGADAGIEQAARLEDVDALGGIHLSEAQRKILGRAIAFRDELATPAQDGGPRLPGAGLRATDMEALKLSLEREVGEERAHIQHGISQLAMVAVVAPLLGLLGTVMGVMTTFTGIQAAGSANIASIAPGVSQALLTTVVGLIAAIPAAMAHQVFLARIEDAEDRLHWFAAEVVSIVAREMRR